MNAIKTLSVLLLLSACTAACADGTAKSSSSEQRSTTTDSTTPATAAGPKKSATPVSPGELLDPRTGARSADLSDYDATDGTYRVYGVEPGDGTVPPSATIAELGTWTTRSYRIGDAFGRGFVVSKIDETSGVTLHGAQADVTLAIAADTNLRVIRHDLDVVAQPLGKHRFQIRTPAAKAALEAVPTRPTAEAATLYDLPMQKLTAVPAGGVFAGADFRAGNLIATIDGKAVDDSAVGALETGLTDGRPKLAVTIYRGGVSFNRTYETDPQH